MNGPEHYLEAERLLWKAHGENMDDGSATFTLAEAQVHATLALTAAQAGVLMREYVEGEDDATAWVKATQT